MQYFDRLGIINVMFVSESLR